MPQKRLYPNGRPTTGWKRGRRVRSLQNLKAGDMLIKVSDQFKAENICRVVRLSKMPAGLYTEYVHNETLEKLIESGSEICFTHVFEMLSSLAEIRFFRAEKEQ